MSTPDLPDEALPHLVDQAERRLSIGQHRWFALATLLATLPAGVALLLPWTFSRRLGQSVWQLGIETQPTLALAWLAGLLAAVLALALRPGQLIAEHPQSVEPDAEDLATAVRRLRQNR